MAVRYHNNIVQKVPQKLYKLQLLWEQLSDVTIVVQTISLKLIG